MDSADLFDPGLETKARSGSELGALLVELARVVKARGFYAPGHPKLGMLFERGLMTWRGDLQRHGDLEFDVASGGFRSAGSHELLGHPQLGALHEAFVQRGIHRLRVEAWMDAEAFAGLVETLFQDPETLRAAGGTLRALYARVPVGVVLNGTPADAMAPRDAAADAEVLEFVDDADTGAPTDPMEPAAPEAATPTPEPVPDEAAPVCDTPADAGPEADAEPVFEPEPEVEDAVLEAALASDDDAGPEDHTADAFFDDEDAGDADDDAFFASDEGELAFVGEEEAPPEEDLDARDDLFGPAGAGTREAADGSALGAPASDGADAQAAAAPADDDAEPPAGPEGYEEEFQFEEPVGPVETAQAAPAEAEEIELTDLPEEAPAERRPSFEELEQGPLERGVVDLQSAELVDLLRELHDCEETTQYLELARRACQAAERSGESGRLEEAYRVMLVLSLHASQRGKRPDRQADVAQDFLVSLAHGDRLEHLIDRACAPGGASSVRATQVLLQLGEEVVPALLGAAVLERDPDRRGQMHGVLIAMGEKTLPELLRAMDADDPELVRTAVRLAGESQNPGAIARLADLLTSSPDREAREEAAKALVRIGTPRAVELLVRAIDDPKVGDVAIYCLGACGSARPVEPLVQAMQTAIDAGRLDRAREIIRALGRLGRAEAVPALAALLLRKSVLGRRKLREMKLAAATALAGLPGDEAVGALAQAARSRDPQLRRVAQTALDRRARSLSRTASA